MQTVLCVEWLLLKCKHSTLYHIETIFFILLSSHILTLIQHIHWLNFSQSVNIYRERERVMCTMAAAAAVAVATVVVAVTARYFV